MPERPFAGNAPLVVKKAFVERGGIETPARGEERDFLDIGIDAILHAEGKWLRGIGVVEAFEAQFLFGSGPSALVPKGSSGPGVSAQNAATIGLHPGMMMQHRAGVEELDAPQLPAQIKKETETGIDIIAWFGQSGAKNDDPAPDGGSDEKLLFTGQTFNP